MSIVELVYFVKQIRLLTPTRPLSPHTELLSRPNFLPPPSSASKLFPAPHSVISYPHAARAPADAEIFLLIRLSHKDGIKKVENTPALAFPLQTVGMIRRQRGVSMHLIEVDIRFLRHELQTFLLRSKSLRPIHICDIFLQYLRTSMQITLRPSES